MSVHLDIGADRAGFQRVKLVGGLVAATAFTVWSFQQELARPLAAAAIVFTAAAAVGLARPPADPVIQVLFDAGAVFVGIYFARPYPGVEATAAALVMCSAIIFCRGRQLRYVLPLVASIAALEGLVNWGLREPVGWTATEMVRNAVVSILAVAPMVFWTARFISRAIPSESLFDRLFDQREMYANAVTENAGEGIAIIDLDSTIQYVNPAFARMFGYRPDDLIGNSMSLVMDDQTFARHHTAARDALLADRQIDHSNMEFEGRHRDGHRVVVLVSVSEIRGGDRRLVLGSVRDVTEIVDLRSRLQDLVAAKDEFIASVSHELRTPLTAVVAFSQMLRDDADMDPQERDEFIHMIAQQSQEVSYLIDDLLVVARLDSETLSISLEPIDLEDEVKTAVRPWLGAAPIVVDSSSLRTPVVTDPRRLRQIVRNLVSNAVKYGGDHIEVLAEPGGPHVCHLVVRDDGPGVRPGREASIFDAYEHGHDVDGQPSSVGLGLHVSRRLADAMGGTLVYRRRDGHTEFVLAIPTLLPESRSLHTPSEGR